MRKVIEYLAELFAIISGVVLLTLVALTSYNIILSNANKVSRIFSYHISSIIGYEDIVVLQIVTAVFLMLPYCQLQFSHITLTFFTNNLSSKINKLLDGFWLLTLLVLVIFLLIQLFIGLLDTKYEGLTSSVLGIKIWPFYISGVVSLLLWAIIIIQQLYELVTNTKSIKDNKKYYRHAI